MSSDRPARTFVVGTAGHVDHGKSTLVTALTGIDPDRLAEEKIRGMTIDLGFAWLRTPAGHDVSIVDVPGHERFIKNMLAGAGGMDAAILVVAADEGPMPQTLEHLAILDLLRVPAGVIALTKSDLVDRDWLDLIREEVRERVAGTTFADAEIVDVSAITGGGLSQLLRSLDATLATTTPWPRGGVARLPVDRVFSIQGFGTVVTGTLLGGEFRHGQDLMVMPAGIPTRIRGLQSHQAKVERASPGSRVAVNVASVGVDQIVRGDVLAAAGSLQPTLRLDVRLTLLADAPLTLEQNAQLDLFIGAAERPAWLTLLDRERIEPGESAWVQLRLHRPVVPVRGDRFIVRRPSPSVTIGGGEIVDTSPLRHRRYRPEVLSALETLAQGSPDEILLQALHERPMEIGELRRRPPKGLHSDAIDMAVAQLVAEGDLVLLQVAEGQPAESNFALASDLWETCQDEVVAALDAFHRSNPLRRGMPKEELRRRVKLGSPVRLFDGSLRAMTGGAKLVDDGATVRLAGFEITLDPGRRLAADRFLEALISHPISPPSPAEFDIDVGTLGAMIDRGEVVRAGEGIVYAPSAFARITREVIEILTREERITIAGYRDHFQTSRKYAQVTLEYLDELRITRRVGDERVRFVGAGAGEPEGAPT